MKQRIEISVKETYELADAARRLLESKNPDTEYQVRKTRRGYKVVERRETSGAV